jgi:predicted MFS family arabinose efflux permease
MICGANARVLRGNINVSGKGYTAEQANFNHLIYDIVWFGLALAATSRFLSMYAIRLGATPEQLNWLAALPGIALLVSAGLSSRWRRRFADTIRAIRWPSLSFRVVFLLPAFAPFLPLEWQPIWLILAVSLSALPQGISGAIFIVLMRESVSQNRLTTLLSRRSLAMNLAIGAGALAFGVLLEGLPFPVNYQVMFLIAFAFTLVSQWHVVSLRILYPEPIQQLQAAEKPASVWQSRGVLLVAFVTFITHIAFFSIIMITPLRLVEDMGATEGFIAIFGMAELVAGATMAIFTDRIIRQVGARSMIAFAMFGTALAALITATAPTLEFTLLAALISGASWTATGIGVFSFLIECTPSSDSTRSAVVFQQVIAAGIFVGPMVGNLLVGLSLSLVEILLIGAALRLLAGVLTVYNTFDLASGTPPAYGGGYPLRMLYRRSRRG